MKIYETKPQTVKDLVNECFEAGERPATMQEIIELRIKDKSYREKFLDTSTAVVVTQDSIIISNINEEFWNKIKNRKLTSGGIKLTKKELKLLGGKSFFIEDLKLNQFLTKEEALNHPLWKEFCGKNLKKYVNLIFKDTKRAMHIGVNVNKENILRLGYVSGFLSRASAGGRTGLGSYGVRFVGVKQESGTMDRNGGRSNKMKCEKCGQEIKDFKPKTLKIKELGIEVQKDVKKVTCEEDLKAPKGWRLLTFKEAIDIENNLKWKKALDFCKELYQEEYFKQPFKCNKEAYPFARAFRGGSGGLGFGSDGLLSSSVVGRIRFCRELSSKESSQRRKGLDE